jgi:hypothetical protein
MIFVYIGRHAGGAVRAGEGCDTGAVRRHHLGPIQGRAAGADP